MDFPASDMLVYQSVCSFQPFCELEIIHHFKPERTSNKSDSIHVWHISYMKTHKNQLNVGKYAHQSHGSYGTSPLLTPPRVVLQVVKTNALAGLPVLEGFERYGGSVETWETWE